jgi:hypothetical protein
VAALTVSAVLGMVPAHALAAEWRARKRWVVALLLTGMVLVCGLPALAGVGISFPGVRVVVTLLVLGAHLSATYLALRATRNMSAMARGVLVSLVLFLMWVLPLVLELLRGMFTLQEAPPTIEGLGMLSPLGLLIVQWTRADPPWLPIAGLVYPWLMPLGLWWLGKRLNRKAPDAAAPATAEAPTTADAPESVLS